MRTAVKTAISTSSPTASQPMKMPWLGLEPMLEGDYVVVRPQETATDGDIVVALVGEEATVKRFFRENDHGKRSICRTYATTFSRRGAGQIWC